MDMRDLLNCLEYTDSPYFLSGSRLYSHPAFSHVFHQAKENYGLQGVYTLSGRTKYGPIGDGIIPAVYVCKATSEENAIALHRLVWNQNTVPFLLVESPKCIRLYPGFKFKVDKRSGAGQEIIKVAKTANSVIENLSSLKASSINRGLVWDKWGKHATQEARVDTKLLRDLKILSKWLRTHHLDKHSAHALIGKFLFLNYLSDRDILSDRRLSEWGINRDGVFSRNADIKSFYSVVDQLDNWLNGSIFPISKDGAHAPTTQHLQKVAAIFSGDDPKTGQMHLNFKAYNFQHIPIETLSIVYQQFLHAEGRGRGQGAYYTPIHLVNFILDGLDSKYPLRKGMTVLDPACGSGAFLVQCYRRLIEREIGNNSERKISPFYLRKLLEDHIYGVDVDEDACGVAELSLTMTLLDYVDPPDLKNPQNKNFRLPSLRDKNIFYNKEGFFSSNQKWLFTGSQVGFDWIIGNPPWKNINSNNLDVGDAEALEWINKNSRCFPVSNNQIAEAFAWEVSQQISDKGVVGLLMPAGTLFKIPAKKFREKFFSKMETWCVVNFSNLRHLLFQGAVNPASAFFYSKSSCKCEQRPPILTYAPFVVNQLSRYEQKRKRGKRIWAITVNGDELKEVQAADAATGDNLSWKIAMWGSHRDRYLLKTLTKQFPKLSEFLKIHDLEMHEGLQLRTKNATEKIEQLKEVIGKNELNVNALKGYNNLFTIPDFALSPVEENRAWVRKGRGRVPLQICQPPHIIVHAARKFAIFSDEFIVVPPRQIGIAGDSSKSNLLKALALYLNSNFAAYHQFICSTFWGVERDRPNKKDIEKLPIPINELSSTELDAWAYIYDSLAKISRQNLSESSDIFFNETRLWRDNTKLRQELNNSVYSLLGLSTTEIWQIEDLLLVRKEMNEGRLAKEAIQPASQADIKAYAESLKSELDDFLCIDSVDKHRITVFVDDQLSIIKVENSEEAPAGPVEVVAVKDKKTNLEFIKLERNLLQEQGQWIYFNRNLKFYRGRTTYFVKPRQRLSWLKSQALIDADEFIAEKLRYTGEQIDS